MKKYWEDYKQKLIEMKVVWEDFRGSTPGKKEWTRFKLRFEAAWKEMTMAGAKLDLFISEPINPVTIPKPWNDPKFWDKWQLYKDFLREQYGFTMMSRLEAESLEKLKEWTNNDPVKATRWVSYYITNHYNKVFKVKEEQTDESTEAIKQKSGKNVIRGIERPIRENTTTGS